MRREGKFNFHVWWRKKWEKYLCVFDELSVVEAFLFRFPKFLFTSVKISRIPKILARSTRKSRKSSQLVAATACRLKLFRIVVASAMCAESESELTHTLETLRIAFNWLLSCLCTRKIQEKLCRQWREKGEQKKLNLELEQCFFVS
jgi:hypothetical protein